MNWEANSLTPYKNLQSSSTETTAIYVPERIQPHELWSIQVYWKSRVLCIAFEGRSGDTGFCWMATTTSELVFFWLEHCFLTRPLIIGRLGNRENQLEEAKIKGLDVNNERDVAMVKNVLALFQVDLLANLLAGTTSYY